VKLVAEVLGGAKHLLQRIAAFLDRPSADLDRPRVRCGAPDDPTRIDLQLDHASSGDQ
jgi:hypothetical protein